MLSRLKYGLANHLRDNIGVYFFIVILFIVGVIFGALAVKALNEQQKSELIQYLRIFFNEISRDQSLPGHEVARQAIFNNLKITLLVWGLGLTVIGIPVILVITFTRGFVLGFTVGFLVYEMAWKGILFSILAVLPHNLISIPTIVIICVTGLSFSLQLIRNKIFKKGSVKMAPQFWSYTFFFSIMGAVLIAASLVEAYITPVFIRLLSGLMLS
ncbi:MAG TPA: stage II sporulation protein M [Clostridia bacterium]|jgi:stage II sporulation protein M|nr:stage II sporulation protein M [Clostridia bacterium]